MASTAGTPAGGTGGAGNSSAVLGNSVMMSGDMASASPDREERIAARRARIAKAQAETADTEDAMFKSRKPKGEAEKKESGKGRIQIAQSRDRLDKAKEAGFEEVTAVRVEQDDRENARRIQEETIRDTLRKKLIEEEEASAKRNIAVTLQWEPLLQSPAVPQTLLKKIEEQKEACYRIIASKDALTKELQNQLRLKDDDYVKALKKQAEDVELLLDRMTKHYREMTKAYDDELEEIERACMEERAELIEANRNEIESLFEKRRKMEVEFMESRTNRVEEDQKELEALRVQDAEEYNILKIRLETDIQNLEQQLEEMRARYQLNTEKLEYNHRVLIERDQENSNTINQQKRKLARLQDSLSSLMSKYAKTDRQFRQENVELTEEYKRITEQYKDLQNKFRHFEIADQRRFQEIWMMNEEAVRNKVRKVLQADKIIHEQQAGLHWYPPSEEIFTFADSDGGDAYLDSSAIMAPSPGPNTLAQKEGDKPTIGQIEASSSSNTDQQQQQQAGEKETQKDPSSLSPEESKSLASSPVKPKIPIAERDYSDNVKAMLSMLASEASFLVEEKVRRVLDTVTDDKEREMMKIDSILHALDVETREDLEKLMSFFLVTKKKVKEPKEETPEDELFGVDEEAEQEVEMEQQLIDPTDAIKAIKAFSEAHQRPDQKRSVSRSAAVAQVDESPTKRAIETKKMRDQSRREEKEFWFRMAGVISDDTFEVWGALEKALKEYNQILVSRANLLEETQSLQQQNEELKALLNNYLHAKVNEDLQIPPTQLLPVTVRQSDTTFQSGPPTELLTH